MKPIFKVRLGAYVPDATSAAPGKLESYSLPRHLRPDAPAVVPNRADRRRSGRR